MIRRPPRSTLSSSSAASDVYKRQTHTGVEGTKSLTRESPSGLMTAPATKGRRPSDQIHCAIVSDECLRTSCQSHRLTRRRCRDGDKARGSAQSQGVQHSRPRILTQISADGNPHCTAMDEHPSGHPCSFFSSRMAISVEGRCLFSHHLDPSIEYTHERTCGALAYTRMHAVHMPIVTFSFSLDAFWAQASIAIDTKQLKRHTSSLHGSGAVSRIFRSTR